MTFGWKTWRRSYWGTKATPDATSYTVADGPYETLGPFAGGRWPAATKGRGIQQSVK